MASTRESGNKQLGRMCLVALVKTFPRVAPRNGLKERDISPSVTAIVPLRRIQVLQQFICLRSRPVRGYWYFHNWQLTTDHALFTKDIKLRSARSLCSIVLSAPVPSSRQYGVHEARHLSNTPKQPLT